MTTSTSTDAISTDEQLLARVRELKIEAPELTASQVHEILAAETGPNLSEVKKACRKVAKELTRGAPAAPLADASSPAPKADLVVGERVALTGLAKPKLNGLHGVARCFSDEAGQYEVLLLKDGRSVNVKPENLECLSPLVVELAEARRASPRLISHMMISIRSQPVSHESLRTSIVCLQRTSALCDQRGEQTVLEAGCVEACVGLLDAHRDCAYLQTMGLTLLSYTAFAPTLQASGGAATVLLSMQARDMRVPSGVVAMGSDKQLATEQACRGIIALSNLALLEPDSVTNSAGAVEAAISAAAERPSDLEILQWTLRMVLHLTSARTKEGDPKEARLLERRRRACETNGALALAKQAIAHLATLDELCGELAQAVVANLVHDVLEGECLSMPGAE